MNISEIQNKILELKKEKDVCILAHSYQAREICEIADFTGDSYKLSVDASKVTNKNILMCGVRFMAETCKILSPDKTVYLAQPSAGCQMADQMDKEMISSVKEMYPDYAVVAYNLNLLASLCIESLTCSCIDSSRILLESYVLAASLLHISSTGNELLYIETSYCDRQQTYWSQN